MIQQNNYKEDLSVRMSMQSGYFFSWDEYPANSLGHKWNRFIEEVFPIEENE